MLKKILYLGLFSILIISLTGCGSKYPNEFGLFSETYNQCILKLNVPNPPDKMGGYLGKWHSENLESITVDYDTEEIKEGKQSIHVKIAPGQWGGGIWFQFGYEKDAKDPAKQTGDLSEFAKGYLVFWVKTSKSLLIKLESRNDKDDKNDEAKVVHDNYNVPIDNTWQKVVIPMEDFQGIDLTKMNVLLGVHYVVPQEACEFWIDNVYFVKELKK